MTLGIEPSGPATEYGYLIADGDRRRGGRDGPVTASIGSRRSRTRRAPRRCSTAPPGVLERRHLPLAPRRDPVGARALRPGHRRDRGGRDRLGRARTRRTRRCAPPRSTTRSWSRPSAAGLVRGRRWTSAGATSGSWTALLAALGGSRRRPGRPGRGVRATAGPDDLVVERIGGRLALHDGPRGILAPTPVALLDGRPPRSRRRRCAARSGRSTGGVTVTNIAEAPAPTNIVFGTDGWRARIADEYTFDERPPLRRRRRPLRGRSGRAGEGRRHRLRPAVRERALRGRGRRGPARARHPGRLRQPRRADPDVELRGRRARGRRPGSSSLPATTRGPTTGSRSRRRPDRPPGRRSCRSSRRRSPTTAGRAIERRPFADAEAAGLVERFDPFEGYERYLRRTVDLDALRAADVSILVEPMWGAGAGWISRLLSGGTDPGDRDPPGAQPVLRRGQPGADPAERRRGARAPRRGAATTSGCCSTATPIGPARPTRRATSSTSSRSPGC